jgi:hypothetical protein
MMARAPLWFRVLNETGAMTLQSASVMVGARGSKSQAG